jgi:hypothetical protein
MAPESLDDIMSKDFSWLGFQLETRRHPGRPQGDPGSMPEPLAIGAPAWIPDRRRWRGLSGMTARFFPDVQAF